MNKFEQMLVENGLLTIEQTAEMLGKSVATVNNWVYAPKRAPAGFPLAISVFGKRFFLQDSIDVYVKKEIAVQLLRLERCTKVDLKRKVGRPCKPVF